MLLDIIIPTYKNPAQRNDLIRSLFRVSGAEHLYHIYLINNGNPGDCDAWKGHPEVTVFDSAKNLGWEGGIKKGLELSDSPFVCFLNDDTYFPASSYNWAQNILAQFQDPSVGAVGPSSNFVMANQNIFIPIRERIIEVKFLIGFCMILRREALEKSGGVDDSLPGGDDLDLSIRLRKAGYRLLADRRIFVYHYGSVTGGKIHGDYWNSQTMQDRTNNALIRKHGIRAYFDLMTNTIIIPDKKDQKSGDSEGEAIRKVAHGQVLELGCGPSKTVPESLGVDIIPCQQPIETVGDRKSQADIVADLNSGLPIKETFDTIICRHILEHLMDPIAALVDWKKNLKEDGTLILALPNEELDRTIPMNPEHLHAFTTDSIQSFLTAAGYEDFELVNSGNNVSFIILARPKKEAALAVA